MLLGNDLLELIGTLDDPVARPDDTDDAPPGDEPATPAPSRRADRAHDGR